MRLVFCFGQLSAELLFESVEPPLPSIASADYRRIDDQLFPFPRRACAARDHRRRIIDRGIAVTRTSFTRPCFSNREKIALRRHERPQKIAVSLRIGHLRE